MVVLGIAQQLSNTFAIQFDKDLVGRVRAAHYRPDISRGGPSWLILMGQAKDSLWSMDLFEVESIHLRTHWILVVMDQFTRTIVGFGLQVSPVDGVALCRSSIKQLRIRASRHGLVWIMIPCLLSRGGKPTYDYWRSKRFKRCPMRRYPIRLSNASSSSCAR